MVSIDLLRHSREEERGRKEREGELPPMRKPNPKPTYLLVAPPLFPPLSFSHSPKLSRFFLLGTI